MFNFAHARARRAVAERRRRREIGAGERLHRQRPARQLEQHDDRRRRQHRHRRQRRQHGDDQHRLGRRVQGPDQRLPGRVRPRGRRPAPGRHQERLAGLPRLGLLVRPAVRLERQQLDQQPRTAPRSPKAVKRDDCGYTFGGPIFIPGFNESKKKLFFFFSQEHQRRTRPPATEPDARADRARAHGRLLAERGQQRQPVPLRPRLHDRPALQRDRHAAAASRTAACSARIPAKPPLRAGPRGPEHLPARELQRRLRASTSRARRRTTRRAARTCSAWTTS